MLGIRTSKKLDNIYGVFSVNKNSSDRTILKEYVCVVSNATIIYEESMTHMSL
jgi:hypothetical protein